MKGGGEGSVFAIQCNCDLNLVTRCKGPSINFKDMTLYNTDGQDEYHNHIKWLHTKKEKEKQRDANEHLVVVW